MTTMDVVRYGKGPEGQVREVSSWQFVAPDNAVGPDTPPELPEPPELELAVRIPGQPGWWRMIGVSEPLADLMPLVKPKVGIPPGTRIDLFELPLREGYELTDQDTYAAAMRAAQAESPMGQMGPLDPTDDNNNGGVIVGTVT